jgi:KRAB domain-containing zinc finger protein
MFYPNTNASVENPGHGTIGQGGKKQCDICGKYFQNNAKLERHRMIHTGVKPFQCEKCHRCFNQKANLKAHMVVHMKDKLII